MIPPTAKKLAGVILAAITLSMVTSVAPAAAADRAGTRPLGPIVLSDSGWGGR
jgi:hypothetical protein